MLVVPVFIVAGFVWIEWSMRPPAVVVPLGGTLTEAQKQVLAISQDLAKFFMALATTLIGGVSFYVNLDRQDRAQRTTYSWVLTIGVIALAVISIFFGHLWIAGLRGQLVNDILDPRASELVYPERFQYIAFLTSLSWFGLLALDRERARLVNGQASPAKGA